MLQNIFQRNPSNEEAVRLKYNHLQTENTKLFLTVQDLQRQIESLRLVNRELLEKSPKSIQILIEELTRQNEHLQKSLFRVVKNNEELSCDILMKNQLICEAEREHRDIVSSLEEKIYEMRVSIQNKEIAVTYIEEKGHQQKEQPYGATTRVNLMYFNQMNELKLMIDRVTVENSQLAFLNSIKDEEIEKNKALIKKYEEALEKKEDFKGFKEMLEQQCSNEKTTKKQQAKNKLEEELTRYDMKYKHLSTSKVLHTPSQINTLKIMLTQLNKENRNIREQKAKLVAEMVSNKKQYAILQEAYKHIQKELQISKVQVEFYRENFKELCRVPAQRKIQFYGEYYQEILPNLEKKLKEKESLISYWKHWKSKNEEVLAKRIMGKVRPLRRASKRSNSFSAKYSYRKQAPRKVCERNKQQTIFNFINQTHNVNSMINHTIEVESKPVQAEQNFPDDISIIIKPKIKQAEAWKKRKPE